MNNEEIADTLIAKYSSFTLSPATILSCLSDLLGVPAREECLHPFCDGLYLGLMLSATQPSTAGGILETIVSLKPDSDMSMRVYAEIVAMLYERMG